EFFIMDKIMEVIDSIWSISLVQFIVYLLLAFLAAGLAQFIVTKLLKLVKLDKLLDKWGVNEGQLGTSMSLVGKLVYIVVFLLFLPSALNALGLEEVSGPLSGMVSTFVAYIPNIVAAGILVYVGIFVALIIGQIIAVLLKKTKIDNFALRADEEKNIVLLSDIIVKIVMSVIILITIVQALIVLDIAAISAPALSIVNAIFSAVPNIILAAVVISCGLLVTNIACGLLSNVLVAAGFDGIVKNVLPQLKVSATKVVVNIVRTLIILLIVAQGIEVLDLAILTTVVTAIVAYLPLVIKSAVIAFVAFVGASMLEGFIVKNNAGAAGLAKIVKIAIYTLAGFMILSQLDIASAIVNTAFVVTLSAIAVAFALAFGLGGKDFAKKTLDKVDEKIENKNEENK
ncbi:MAG: mechanosensitive ion channel, partial [Clostridia bacterium]|nr:mechanosensitive ion channel [Clostridia bacterium]